MTTVYAIAGDPTVVPEVKCIIVPFHGKKLEVFGLAAWLTNYARYFVKLGMQLEHNTQNNDELAKTEPILVKAQREWKTTIDIVFVNDDLTKPSDDVVYQALRFAQQKGYTNVSMQLIRSGKEPYPQAENQKRNALAMLSACDLFPEMHITIALNSLEQYAYSALQNKHVSFLGFWHEEVKKFLPN